MILKYLATLLFVISSCLFPGKAISDDRPALPLASKKTDWLPLYEHVDPFLQAKLEQRLRQNKEWKILIAQKKLAVGLVDLSDPMAPKFARVNGRHMMYSASLPKIAILLAAFQKIEDGELRMTPEIRKDLTDMIRSSSNQAATRMIDRVGGLNEVNAVLTDPRYNLYDEALGGGLWVGKRYQKGGRRIPDPIFGISHGGSVTQVCRFYYLLATGRLVSRERSKQMLEILVDPAIKHKFVAALLATAPDADIYRKSGTWKQWHSDSALVWGPAWRRYILVGMVESSNGEKIMRSLVTAVEEVLPHE